MYKIKNYDNINEIIHNTPLTEKIEDEILREEAEKRWTRRKRTKNFRKNPQHRCQDCHKPVETDAEHRHHNFCFSCWTKRKRKNEGIRK